jgi:uncharacterized protein YdiU (UPF0061 family)
MPSDYQGRYAFDRQPSIGLWNLTCLAQAMLPLFDADDGEAAAEQARDALAGYEPVLVEAYAAGMRAKLGLRNAHPDDRALSARLLELMAADGIDYTNLFRDLADVRRGDPCSVYGVRDRFADRPAVEAWLADYRARLDSEQSDDVTRARAMRAVNPRYILRNYLAQQAIDRAERGDYAELERLRTLLARPYDEQPEMAAYADEPPQWGRELEVSCSS